VKLRRFWFRFGNIPAFDSMSLGCGVTAYSCEDALAILRETVFKGADIGVIEKTIEDIDISSLDQKHIIPNMESPAWRGVWYPKGFAFHL
jgi:hypothetical protein